MHEGQDSTRIVLVVESRQRVGMNLQVLENPLPNVVACPLEEDIFTWHGNGALLSH